MLMFALLIIIKTPLKRKAQVGTKNQSESTKQILKRQKLSREKKKITLLIH